MSTLTTRRLAASGMAGAALLAIAGFTALGSIFDYPKILKEPTDHILEAFRENQTAVTSWFLVLVISAALLAPVGVLLGRIAGGTRGRWIGYLGYASAALIATGVLVPFGVGPATMTNFIGYVAWCGWLIVMAVVLWRSAHTAEGEPSRADAAGSAVAAGS